MNLFLYVLNLTLYDIRVILHYMYDYIKYNSLLLDSKFGWCTWLLHDRLI